MKIVMVGTGYVGLVTGACFAERGHFVVCLDIDQAKIETLRQGSIPIYEPGLEELVIKNTKEGRLLFTTDYQMAVENADACFIGVPTPSSDDGSCNTSYVQQAARQIAKHLNGYCVIVNKSTVPVGTADSVKTVINQELELRKANVAFDVVSNPEFLKEGAAIEDCMFPDRIIIGSETKAAADVLKKIYAPFPVPEDRVLFMDIRSAEMTKYAANAMLAARISFMNEIAMISKQVGANVNEIQKGIGLDRRIGPSFLFPGVGYGGSCFPKDIRALISISKAAGIRPQLLEAVDSVNLRQKKLLAAQIRDYFGLRGGIAGKTIAIWGLSFKPETDDMREAPSLEIIGQLLEQGVTVRLYDPVAMLNAKKILGESPQITWCSDEAAAANGADAIALVTEWKQFRNTDLNKIGQCMKRKALFDGRNQFQAIEMQKKGFDYIPIGAPDSYQHQP